MALIGTPDDFDTGSSPSGIWEATGLIAPVLTGGRLRLQAAGTVTEEYAGVVTNGSFNITGNEFYAKVAPSPTSGNHEHLLEYRRTNDATGLQIAVSGADIYCGLATALQDKGAYNATSHAWWRISESGGTVSFWTSPDAGTLTWTLLGTVAKPTWATTGFIQMFAGHYAATPANTDTYFDNFNVPPGGTSGGGGGFPTGADEITWSGRTWDVRVDTSPSEPGPNLWSSSTTNVRVEGTELVVAVAPNGPGGKWTSAEVDCQQHLGYGTYTWVVNTDLSTIDAYEVLGLFTWGDGADASPHNNSNNEIDIEAARWGSPTGQTGNLTVWVNFATNVTHETLFSFSSHPPYVCQFTWAPGKVTYSIRDSLGTVLSNYTVTASDVPVPSNEVPIVNYWRFIESENYDDLVPPAALKEIRVASFTFAAPGAPVNTATPAITGTAQTGQVLTCSQGTWSGSPTSYAYQWKRAGTNISGATSSTHTCVTADEGQAITCTVTATNGSGSTAQGSNTVTPSSGTGAPVNTVAPAVTGTATTGQTLTCTSGTWTASPTPTYAYQWKRAGASISGATSSTYVLQTADAGLAVKCTVTATNTGGSAAADSNTVTPGAGAGAPANSVAPAVTGTAFIGQVLTCAPGTWSGTPTSYAYQWKRGGVAIGGITRHLVLTKSGTWSATLNINGEETGNLNYNYNAASVQTILEGLSFISPGDLVVTGTSFAGGFELQFTAAWAAANPTLTILSGAVWPGGMVMTQATNTYVLTAADAGQAIKCTVTATNASGSAAADSNTVTSSGSTTPPVNTVSPAVIGVVTIGQTLTCTVGTWTGIPAPTFTYQWKRAGVAIAGATSNGYTLAVADGGQAIRCTVTGTNPGASASADSNTVSPTTGEGPPVDPTVPGDVSVPVDPGAFVAGELADADEVDARFLPLYTALQGLGPGSIRDRVVGAAQIEVQPAWQTVALAGTTWIPASLSFYRDSIGVVRVRGELFSISADVAAGTTIATLPAGYRPGVTSYFYGRGATATAFLSITTAGVVKANQRPIQGGQCSFNIEFLAEN